MKYISKAPLRLGLAGGGTDVSPYSDMYGGAILNATIDLYATVVLIPRTDGKVVFHTRYNGKKVEFEAKEVLEEIPELKLQIGVYNRIVKDFSKKPLSCEVITALDAPTGSGLGTSSTLVVAIIGAFVEWLKLPLGEYDIAQLATSIERVDLQMAGGKQDQYAATFGGFNFMEFYAEKVIVNPLRIKQEYISELEFNMLLYYTGTSRLSANIIDKQTAAFRSKKNKSIEAAHKLKEQAIRMKEAILTGKLDEIGEILDFGWHYKKQMASGITNDAIDLIYEVARKAGASGGKISGAGGGGFIMFYCPGNTRYDVIEALEKQGGDVYKFSFTKEGLNSWTIA